MISEFTEHNEVYSKPIRGNIRLKQHQLCSLHRCIQIENGAIDDLPQYGKAYSNIGILADKAGSGKSYVMLGLIAANYKPQNVMRNVNVFSEAIYIEYTSDTFEHVGINVIVCPFSIIDQWTHYIKTFDPETVFFVVNTNKGFLHYKSHIKDPHSIVLVSSSFYHMVEKQFKVMNVMVSRVIFDEADSALTKNARRLPSLFYWFVSASYNNVINPYPRYVATLNSQGTRYVNRLVSSGVCNNVFIKSLFGSLMRSLPHRDKVVLEKLIVKNSDSFVSNSFALPEIEEFYIRCVDTISELVNCMTTNQNIISCVNAGDLITAMSYLNRANKGDETHIIDIMKDDLNKQLINCRLKIKYQSELIVHDTEAQTNKIEMLMSREEAIVLKINMMEERIKHGDLCTICYSNFTNKTVVRCCKNAFCFECICTWLQVRNTCPICKHELPDIHNDLFVIKKIDEASSSSDNNTSIIYKKQEALIKLVTHIKEIRANGKILVFSEYERPFMDVMPALDDMNINYGMLKGSSLKGNIQRYKNTELDVLLINSKAFGSGINLENTTDIVIYHSFNKEIQSQVIGRAQRPGRTTPLKVWYLLNNSELEKNPPSEDMTEYDL